MAPVLIQVGAEGVQLWGQSFRQLPGFGSPLNGVLVQRLIVGGARCLQEARAQQSAAAAGSCQQL